MSDGSEMNTNFDHEIEKADRWKIQSLIRKAQSNDRKAARDAATALIREFVFASQKRPRVEPKLVEYFANCFETYLNKHGGDNDFWPDAMNTRGESGQLIGIEERNRKLLISYAAHLNSRKSKESFIREVVKTPPDYWIGKPPSRDSLIKLLPPKDSEKMRHYREVMQMLLPPESEQED